MATVDPLGNRCDRRVLVHIRELWKPPYDLGAQVRCAQQFFGKYGVFFDVVSWQTVHAPQDVHARVVRIAVPKGVESPEWRELYRRFGVQRLSAITAFVVQKLHRPSSDAGPKGTSMYSPAGSSVIIGADASDWVLAHEVGHVLLGDRAPGHSSGPNELMKEGPAHITTEADPVFNIEQVNAMRKSPLCLAC